MLTNPNKELYLKSQQDCGFFMDNWAQSRLKMVNRYLADNRNVPFYLERKMSNIYWSEKEKARSKKRKQYFLDYQHKRLKLRMNGKRFVGADIPLGIKLQDFIQITDECQICSYKSIDEKYKGLLIHHKDKNNQNHKIENLMLLCRGCHNTLHKSKKEFLV